jgi:NADPH-dependent 2,4-dienoyl-CoA reductase/sulfur reductase-like enzyme
MSGGGVLIVGAGLAGARCAETLRAEGYERPVVLAGDEPLPPYERPALSKELLAGARERVELRPPGYWAEHGIELRLGARVENVDPADWDAVVLATGARARELPGALTLRTHADALALRRELRPGRRVVVVGAGFLGAEVASTALALGARVTVVEAAPAPLARVLGEEVGMLLARRQRRGGVDLRLGVGVARILGRGVELTDGTVVPADVVVAAIGAQVEPVETDACGRTATPGVHACGDVASWWRPSLGRHLRVEHWTSAAGQGAAVARAILGGGEPYDEPPYFWSDQFGLRLQHVGHADGWARVELDGDEASFVARYLDAEGRTLAALAANRQAEIGALRRELAAA